MVSLELVPYLSAVRCHLAWLSSVWLLQLSKCTEVKNVSNWNWANSICLTSGWSHNPNILRNSMIRMSWWRWEIIWKYQTIEIVESQQKTGHSNVLSCTLAYTFTAEFPSLYFDDHSLLTLLASTPLCPSSPRARAPARGLLRWSQSPQWVRLEYKLVILSLSYSGRETNWECEASNMWLGLTNNLLVLKTNGTQCSCIMGLHIPRGGGGREGILIWNLYLNFTQFRAELKTCKQ